MMFQDDPDELIRIATLIKEQGLLDGEAPE